MFFCYIDESGDCGIYDPNNLEKSGSIYFILAGTIISSNQWKYTLDAIKSFRKRIAKDAYLPYHIEFHCAELIDPHKTKEYTQIKVEERWELISEFAYSIGQFQSINLIAIVIDKMKSTLPPENYLKAGITELYKAFDEFLKIQNQNGIVFFDRANEKQINTQVRRLLGTGFSGEKIQETSINRVIEDPIFRISSDSMFIQLSDVVAYTLKEHEFPKGSRKKFNADKIFPKHLKAKCFKASNGDELGIIRL
jgi:hypothetical protein